jgi:hypothetical protein
MRRVADHQKAVPDKAARRTVAVRLLLGVTLAGGALFAGCAKDEHHTPDGQTPPSMGDYNNGCNPKSKNHVGSHLPKSQQCYQGSATGGTRTSP